MSLDFGKFLYRTSLLFRSQCISHAALSFLSESMERLWASSWCQKDSDMSNFRILVTRILPSMSSTESSTVTIWIPDMSIFDWSKNVWLSFSLGFEWWSENRAKNVVLCSKMSGIWMICLITWSNHLKTGYKSVSKVKCSDFGCRPVSY